LPTNKVVPAPVAIEPLTAHNKRMRKVILLLIYLGMIVLGAFAFLGSLMHGGKLLFLWGGAFLCLFGAYLAWTDFIGKEHLKS